MIVPVCHIRRMKKVPHPYPIHAYVNAVYFGCWDTLASNSHHSISISGNTG